eukprot:755211-Hanusia_phi.AAC.1
MPGGGLAALNCIAAAARTFQLELPKVRSEAATPVGRGPGPARGQARCQTVRPPPGRGGPGGRPGTRLNVTSRNSESPRA